MREAPQELRGERAPRVAGPERRQGILDAARESFIRHGYDGARTKEIAERAGISEGVLYRFFDSKEALFDEAVLKPLTDWLDAISVQAGEVGAARSSRSREATLRAANETLLDALIEATPLLGVALYSNTERGRQFYTEHFYPLLEKSFGQAARAMSDWTDPDFDPQFLMLNGIGTYLAVAMDAHFRGGDVDVAKIAGLYVRMMMRGATKRPTR